MSNQRLTIEQVKEQLIRISPNIEILSNEYFNNHTKLQCECKIDGNIWNASWNKLKQGRGCPKCKMVKISIARATPKYGESVYDTFPELLKYFKEPDVAKSLKKNSHKKAKLICPDCNYEKEVIIDKLTSRGFYCDICSDKDSLPNRFLKSLVNSLKLNFKTEKKFNWSLSRKYDVYLPNLNTIIEIHGIQHYEKSNRGRSLQQEQDNDLLKEKLAKENGIEHYIVINASNSNFNELKEQCINSMSYLIDLSRVDWDDVINKSTTKNIIISWEMWNNGATISEIAVVLNVSPTTIARHLKLGNSINKVIYVPDKKYCKS